MDNEKWNNYFDCIESKYNLKMNKTKPIVIFVDGKNITNSLKYNLIAESKNSFNDIFEQTIKYFSAKFNCLAISGVDEVSFILDDGKNLKNSIRNRNYSVHEIVSIFSQQFYKYFNNKYLSTPIYWHCKCSNIPKGKVKSYIRYRSLTIFELNLTYLLKRLQIIDAGKIALSEKEKRCNKIPEYKKIKKFEKGKLYLNGQQISLEDFINNNKIVYLPETEREKIITSLNIKDL